jgi:hypothetical protein
MTTIRPLGDWNKPREAQPPDLLMLIRVNSRYQAEVHRLDGTKGVLAIFDQHNAYALITAEEVGVPDSKPTPENLATWQHRSFKILQEKGLGSTPKATAT